MRLEPALKAELIAEAAQRHVDLATLVTLILTGWLTRNREGTIDVLDETNRTRSR